MTSPCKLPSVDTFFSDEISSTTEGQHNDECIEINQDIFDMLSQPCMENSYITEDEFDSLKSTPISKSAPTATTDPNKTPRPPTPTPQRITRQSDNPEVKTEPTLKEENFTCNTCGKIFDKKQSLDFHNTFHTGARRMCPVPDCSKSFISDLGFKKHMSSHEAKSDDKKDEKKEKPDPSPQSKTVQKKVEPVQKKVDKIKIEKNDKTFEATSSDEEFQNAPLPEPGKEDNQFYSNLTKDVHVNDGTVRFVCRMCLSTFTRRADVKRHWKNTCPSNPFPEITCRHCLPKKVIFRGVSSLIAHIFTHGLKGEYVCLRCHTLFQTEAHRDQHLDICTVKPKHVV